MMGRDDLTTGDGFSVLDGAALVAGAAVASIHIRGVVREEHLGPGWILIWGSFLWIALSAAGPFVYLVRRYARRMAGFPAVGERLWLALGMPWLLAASLLSTPGARCPACNPTFVLGLSLGLGLASFVALAVVWSTWVAVSPEQASRTFSGPWTNRVGLVLAVCWPVQCGVGMVLIG